MGFEEYDRHIRADEAEEGDKLQMAVTGGDEYVTLEAAEEVAPGEIRLAWNGRGGSQEDTVPADQIVRVRR